MNAFLPLLVKEAREILRDRYMLSISFVMPVVLLFLFAYGISFDVDRIPTALVDYDASSQSVAYARRFFESGYFDPVAAPRSFAQANHLLETDQVKSVIVVPADFSHRLAQGLPSPVQLVIDGSFPPTAMVAMGYAQGITNQYSAQRVASIAASTGARFRSPVDIESRYLYNPDLKTKYFVVPGLLAVILLAFPPLLSSLAIVRERERGSLVQVRLAGVTPAAFIAAKTIPYAAIAFLELLIILAFGTVYFRVGFAGAFVPFAGIASIYVAAAVGIGILISTITQSPVVAMLVSLIATLMPSFLFGGFLYPIYNMPPAVQAYTYLFPARYFIEIVRGIWLKGNTLFDLWEPALFLGVYAGLVLSAALWRAKALVR